MQTPELYHHRKQLLTLAEAALMLFRPWLHPHHHIPQPQSYSSPWRRLCRCSGHGHTPKHHNQKSYSLPWRRMCQGCSGLGYGAIITTYHHKLLLTLAEDVPMWFRPWLLHTMTTSLATPPSSAHTTTTKLLLTLAKAVPMLFKVATTPSSPRPQSYSSPWQRLCRWCSGRAWTWQRVFW